MDWREILRPKPRTVAIHRGRIYRDGAGFWRYKCLGCVFGAGSNSPGHLSIPWLLKVAASHAKREMEVL